MAPGEEYPPDVPRWYDGYRLLVGPFRHNDGWRLVIHWAPEQTSHETVYDFATWREADEEHRALIRAWTDPDGPPPIG